jgi:hypothetical protein
MLWAYLVLQIIPWDPVAAIICLKTSLAFGGTANAAFRGIRFVVVGRRSVLTLVVLL